MADEIFITFCSGAETEKGKGEGENANPGLKPRPLWARLQTPKTFSADRVKGQAVLASAIAYKLSLFRL